MLCHVFMDSIFSEKCLLFSFRKKRNKKSTATWTKILFVTFHDCNKMKKKNKKKPIIIWIFIINLYIYFRCRATCVSVWKYMYIVKESFCLLLWLVLLFDFFYTDEQFVFAHFICELVTYFIFLWLIARQWEKTLQIYFRLIYYWITPRI